MTTKNITSLTLLLILLLAFLSACVKTTPAETTALTTQESTLETTQMPTAPSTPPETTFSETTQVEVTTQPDETTVPPTTTELPTVTEPVMTTEATVPSTPAVTEVTVPETNIPETTVPETTIPETTAPHVHSYTDNSVPATCTEKGYTKHTCACGDTYNDHYTDPTGHKYETTVYAPTCAEDGYTHYKCAVCNNEYTDAVIPAPGHSWGEWTTLEEPTHYTRGWQERICKVCEKVDKERLPQLEMTTEFMQQEVLRLVNIEREKAGVAPLVYFTEAQAAADIRAKEISTFFAHSRPDGSEYYDIFDEVGLTNVYNIGENILRGTDDPREAFECWFNSPGHKENILRPSFRKIVIGIYEGYWVQLFVG